jgi:adenosine deaminase CECR1
MAANKSSKHEGKFSSASDGAWSAVGSQANSDQREWVMKRSLILFVCLLSFWGCGSMPQKQGSVPRATDDTDTYMKAREELKAAELGLRIGAGIELTAAEEKANRRLMALKRDDIERTRAYFPPAHNFLKSETKQLIDRSPILEIMKRLPKGGILHGHGLAMGDYHWLVKNATYHRDCYIYQGQEEPPRRGSMTISAESPGEGWRLVNDLRKSADDVEAFDEELYRSITLGEEDLDQPDIWAEFRICFARSMGLVMGEFFDGYCDKLLRDLIAENVQYVETRSDIGSREVIDRIRRDHPEFGVKYIFSVSRAASREHLAERLSRALDLRAEDPSSMIGFDLVEEEDQYHSTLFFIDELLGARGEAGRRGLTLPFYLHSGESNWTENENVLDAVLLDSRRIGHGLALFKHPLLMQRVKERGIAIEVCPISNQVLGYVADLRNHPAVLYIANGLPVVVCPDDQGIWRATFSHDFYAAFMAWGLDLKDLKQLAMNSLLYSAMAPEEKERALRYWRGKWEEFIAWLSAYGA